MIKIPVEFIFGKDCISKIIQEIRSSDKYIKIAIFQIRNDSIFDELENALKRKIEVEILTLPITSVKEKFRINVERRIKKLEELGGKIYFLKWSIGDPTRTTTGVEGWYSFHGKFIVTDKSAIALSANLLEHPELDVMLIYRNNDKIELFNQKFNLLMELFVKGKIKDAIIKSNYSDPDSLFQAPKNINNEEIIQYWIKDYPMDICPGVTNIENTLYIIPFDVRARDLYKYAIEEAEKFILISAETFTDTRIMPLLIKNAREGKTINILTGIRTQDFAQRNKELYPRLIANNIDIRKPEEDIHAKVLITDKHLLLGSINLNLMNLGYPTQKNLWRTNTETIMVENDYNILQNAKNKFLEIFNNSISFVDYSAEKEKSYAESIFRSFGIRAKKEVIALFNRFIINKDINLKKTLYDIGRYAYIIVKKFKNYNNKEVEINDFLEAMILYYLSERKRSKEELENSLKEIYPDADVNQLINDLISYGLIIVDEEYIKIKIEKLLG